MSLVLQTAIVYCAALPIWTPKPVDQVRNDTGQYRSLREKLIEEAQLIWQHRGRAYIARNSGVRWNEADSGWHLAGDWPTGSDAGAAAYNLEPPLRGVLALAEAEDSQSLLEELAQFYLSYLGRFTTIDSVQARQASVGAPVRLRPHGSPAIRTLPWIDRNGPWPAECLLCNAQVLHPAARLLRLIVSLPESRRTPVMNEFVQKYESLLVQEHLVRWLFDTRWPVAPRDSVQGLVEVWERAVRPGGREGYRMLDRDLWLIATCAELLEAHRRDPNSVSLAGNLTRLQHAVDVGVVLLKSRTSLHVGGRDHAGRPFSSLGYFEGDFDTHEDFAFAGDTQRTFPADRRPSPATGVSWDVSHIQRLPVTLRSLWDARMAIGLHQVDSAMIAATIIQYVEVAFQGDWQRPRFNNYFDGRDGWYRAGYAGRQGWGYPPSAYCDNQELLRPCLSRGASQGWGLLALLSPDLARMGAGMVELALDSTPDAKRFRDRYYGTAADPFKWCAKGDLDCSILLGEIIGEYSPRILAAAMR